MNGIVVGKRIPAGVAVNGAVVLFAWYYNMGLPLEQQLSILEVGALSSLLTAVVQMIVVNCFGVTNVQSPKD
jgi:hypothetical protein